jgi:hypothetical protein
VKLSILADVGNSSFVYDMRNIKEVFVFPKIWYRRSLARRVFLGEDASTSTNGAGAANVNKQTANSSGGEIGTGLNGSEIKRRKYNFFILFFYKFGLFVK